MQNTSMERVESPTLREEVFHLRLPSGLTVSFCPKRGFQKKYACYSAAYGSVDNEFIGADGERVRVPDGIAHFLEHTLFENEEANVSDLFSLNGASNNAYTSFTQTTYLFSSSDHFFDNLGLLVDFVQTPAFRAEKVEKERGIIEQEISGYEDDSGWVGYMGLLENLFQKHSMRIDIAGTAESIADIDVDTLQRCYDRFYHPANMHLFVAGDVDRDELFQFVSGRSRVKDGVGRPIERLYPSEPVEVANVQTRRNMDVAMPKLLVGFKETDVPRSGREFVLRELVSQMCLSLLFGRSSDAFLELYGKQLILDDFSAGYDAEAGIGFAIISGDTPRPDELLEEILRHARKACESGLDDADFERGKRKFIGSFIRGFNSLEYISNNYTYYYFHDFDLFETIDLLGTVRREMLEERMRQLLQPRACASYVILPR